MTAAGRGGRRPRRASRRAPPPGCGAGAGARARRGPGRRRGAGAATPGERRPRTVRLRNCSRSETISTVVDVSVERTIPAPPDTLWPLLDDPGRLGEWFAFADRGEVLEGEGVGRRQRMHGHWGRKRSEIDQVVARPDAPPRPPGRTDPARRGARPAAPPGVAPGARAAGRKAGPALRRLDALHDHARARRRRCDAR